jgi:hypothetical protein
MTYVYIARGISNYENIHRTENRMSVGSTWKLLPYCQWPDNFHPIFQGIFGIFAVLYNFCFGIIRFLAEALKI